MVLPSRPTAQEFLKVYGTIHWGPRIGPTMFLKKKEKMKKSKQFSTVWFKYLSSLWDPDKRKQISRCPKNAFQCTKPPAKCQFPPQPLPSPSMQIPL